MHVIPDDTTHIGRWLIPVLAGLGVLGLLWYLLSGANPPQVTTATAPAVQVPPPAPAPSLPARLALSNDDGVITYSGAVHDEATRSSIIDALRGVFGASKIKGDITLDANAGPAPWMVNLRTALAALQTPGVQAVFNGNSLKIGGLIGDTDRDGIISSLRSTLGTGLVLGPLSDKVGDLVSDTTKKTVAALSSLRSGFTASDVLGILNQSIINSRPAAPRSRRSAGPCCSRPRRPSSSCRRAP